MARDTAEDIDGDILLGKKENLVPTELHKTVPTTTLVIIALVEILKSALFGNDEVKAT